MSKRLVEVFTAGCPLCDQTVQLVQELACENCQVQIYDLQTALVASLIGTAIAALCCFTPILVILLGAVGLSAVVGYLDYVLLPALAIFAGLTVISFIRYRQSQGK